MAREAVEALLQSAALAAPREACGLLLGSGSHIGEAREARNVAFDSEIRFEIDPQALIDAHRAERGGGPELLGYFHSHPSGPAEPSATDRELASGDGRIWAIAAQGMLSIWRDGKDGFEPLSYLVVDG